MPNVRTRASNPIIPTFQTIPPNPSFPFNMASKTIPDVLVKVLFVEMWEEYQQIPVPICDLEGDALWRAMDLYDKIWEFIKTHTKILMDEPHIRDIILSEATDCDKIYDPNTYQFTDV
jgi:hypothetical protein